MDGDGEIDDFDLSGVSSLPCLDEMFPKVSQEYKRRRAVFGRTFWRLYDVEEYLIYYDVGEKMIGLILYKILSSFNSFGQLM